MQAPSKKKSLSWDDLHTLATLAKEKAYAPAAQALKLSRGTVVRRIQRLEKALGIQVIEEAMGQVRMTADGQRIVTVALQMQDLAASLATPAQGTQHGIRGTVRVTAPEGIAAYLVGPELCLLQEAHPGLHVEILADSDVLSISHKQADIAIRLQYPSDSNLIALPADPLTYSLYAATQFVQRRGPAEVLREPVLIGYDESGSRFPESMKLAELYPQRPLIRSNSLFAQIEAVRAGAGMALLPDYLQQRFPDLVKLSKAPLLTKEVFIVFHGKDRDTEKIRVVIDRLKTHLHKPLTFAENLHQKMRRHDHR